MHTSPVNGRLFFLAAICAWFFIGAAPSQAQTGARASEEIRIKALQGTAEISPAGAATWVFTTTGQLLHPGDRLRIGPNSRATLLWSDQSAVTLDPLAEIEILPPHLPGAEPGLNLFRGILSFFHRGKPGRIRAITRSGTAGVDGTEFVIAVESINNIERTTVYVIDGKVSLSNALGFRRLTSGQSAMAEPGTAPQPAPGFIVNNILQWCFYYPAVLDLRDLPLTLEEAQLLRESLIAYRSGDLLSALKKYPGARKPTSDAERIYYAALLLSVGQVTQTETILVSLTPGASDQITRLAAALRQLIAAVRRDPNAPNRKSEIPNLSLSTELLASSYCEQSRALGDATLTSALRLARQSATNSPEFGFAWAHVAELEFSFGHTRRAVEALDKSLALAPRNAESLALKGFLLAAQNKTREAIEWFTRAIAVDAALGNAWLGRGLCRIRRGDSTGGHEDLLIAAALEPQRAPLRSYLGKAFGDAGERNRAFHELDLAKEMDPADPTAWLYSALLKAQNNRVNEAMGDLEESIKLNGNRRLYRSELLLDQDRAVRSANLASIYRDLGMFDWSVQEASRGVTSDYANYSSHLFLANSYNDLRDPNLVDLRFETATFSEYLIANLLAPAGASAMSPNVSQQEYSRLFERDRLGLSSSTTYLSRGDWEEAGSQFGVLGNSSYVFDAFYRSLNGQRPNNDLAQLALSAQLKQQLTPQDSVYLQVIYNDLTSGDVRQFYNDDGSNPNLPRPSLGLRVHETQEPNLFAGYHREWAPGSHTLFLGGRLNDNFILGGSSNAFVTTFISGTNGVPVSTFSALRPFDLNFQSDFNAYSAEVQQIWERPGQTLIAGARYQSGDTDTRSVLTYPPGAFPPVYDVPASATNTTTDLQRLSLYSYYHLRIVEPFLFIAGVAYDHLNYPQNINSPPVSAGQQKKDSVSPKAGFVWTPAGSTMVRGAYTRSLGGLFFDSSVRLEPSQIAGFNQAFRSLIPESIEGAIPGAEFETFGLGLNQRFPSRTYLGVDAELLRSTAIQTVGTFNYIETFGTGLPFMTAFPFQTRRKLDFEEKSLTVNFNQLAGDAWSLGARYRLSQAELKSDFWDIAESVLANSRNRAVLQQLNLFAIYNHPSGFFAQANSLWAKQLNYDYNPPLPGADFWQLNAFIGYRFPYRRAELTLGALNLTDQNYRLNPLNLYGELPRTRTLLLSLKFYF